MIFYLPSPVYFITRVCDVRPIKMQEEYFWLRSDFNQFAYCVSEFLYFFLNRFCIQRYVHTYTYTRTHNFSRKYLTIPQNICLKAIYAYEGQKMAEKLQFFKNKFCITSQLVCYTRKMNILNCIRLHCTHLSRLEFYIFFSQMTISDSVLK